MEVDTLQAKLAIQEVRPMRQSEVHELKRSQPELPKLEDGGFSPSLAISPSLALSPSRQALPLVPKMEEFTGNFGEISDIETSNHKDNEEEGDEIAEVQLFANRPGPAKRLEEIAEKTSPFDKPAPQETPLRGSSDIHKRIKELKEENDHSDMKDSVMTGEISISQLNRYSRHGLFLIDEYFLIGIGSYTRKNLSMKPSNSTIKYQLSGIFHQPGKRFRFYHQNLLADNNLASEGLTFMHEINLSNEAVSK